MSVKTLLLQLGLLCSLAAADPDSRHLYPVRFHTWPERLWVYRYLPENPSGQDPCFGSTDRPVLLELKQSERNDPWLLYFVYSPGGQPEAVRAPEIARMVQVIPGQIAAWGRYPEAGSMTVYLTPAQRWRLYRDRYGLGIAGALAGLAVLALAWRRSRRVEPAPARPLGEELEVGDRLAGYQILARLGQGASATVYRVKDEQGRELALKRFRADVDFQARFRREMKALAQLRHPHLPFLQDYGEHEGRLYLVMELLGDTDLKSLLARGPLPGPEALRYFRQLCSVVANVHDLGITHRDIKPENVVFGRDGKLRLTDFGLARTRDATTITREGGMLGTPAYMAPEWMEGQPTGPAADQYSLGCLAYELFVGQPPFRGDSPVAVAVQHVRSPVPETPMMPPEVRPVILRMLSKLPEQRYPDLHQVVSELQAVQEIDQR